jgi:hypothetical protein
VVTAQLLAPHGTLVCCTRYQSYTFHSVQLSLLAFFFCQTKLIISAEWKSPRVGFFPQHSFLIPLFCNLYTNDIPQTSGTYLSLFADNNTTLHATGRREDYVLSKPQRNLPLWRRDVSCRTLNTMKVRLGLLFYLVDFDWRPFILEYSCCMPYKIYGPIVCIADPHGNARS